MNEAATTPMVKTLAEMRDVAVKVLKPYRKILMETGRLYATTYPPEKTPGEVLNAVTIAVGYMPLFGLLLAMEACFASVPKETEAPTEPKEPAKFVAEPGDDSVVLTEGNDGTDKAE